MCVRADVFVMKATIKSCEQDADDMSDVLAHMGPDTGCTYTCRFCDIHMCVQIHTYHTYVCAYTVGVRMFTFVYVCVCARASCFFDSMYPHACMHSCILCVLMYMYTCSDVSMFT